MATQATAAPGTAAPMPLTEPAAKETVSAERATPTAILPPKRVKDVLSRLAEPFGLDVISWKPQVTSYKDPENPKAKGAAYADQRAYSDRLNEIVGPNGWTREYSVHIANNLDRVVKGANREEKVITNQAKVFVVARVTIYGLGAHTGTGEAWIDDDNAFTSAEAQAFKRACVCFGLGRYLYELPETDWLPIDKYSRQFKIAPAMPDWAVPSKKACQGCSQPIVERTINRVPYTAQALSQRGRELYGQELCADCQIERAKVLQQSARQQAGKVPA